MSSFPCLARFVSGSGQVRYRLGDRLVDRYLEFVAGRCRPNTLRAVAFDLKAFFTVIGKDPVEVAAADVFEFLADQRGDRTVVRLADRESGLSARTIARRLSSVSGLYGYLVARGDTPVGVNPVPRGLLRRCEVLGLRFEDVQVADRRLAVVEGKGGHHRVVPAANRFFDALGAYLHDERPAGARTDRVFVVLKGPRRGLPLSAEGLDEVLAGARRRAGLDHATCHELRHTCLTRLREAGMALEAVQAQAGHRSIESTRVYLHLANDWLAGEYRRAAELIDADTAAVAEMLAVQEAVVR